MPSASVCEARTSEASAKHELSEVSDEHKASNLARRRDGLREQTTKKAVLVTNTRREASRCYLLLFQTTLVGGNKQITTKQVDKGRS